MSISIDEQEVVINFSRGDERASLYATDKTWWTKMDKRVAENPKEFTLDKEDRTQDGDIVAKTYSFPVRYLSIRWRDRPELSPEQREKAGIRLRAALEQWKAGLEKQGGKSDVSPTE